MPLQQLARLGANGLSVREMTGVVVGDAHGDGAALGARLDLGQELGHVTDLLRERLARSAQSGSSRSTCP